VSAAKKVNLLKIKNVGINTSGFTLQRTTQHHLALTG
jgi:hypothetical protein